MKIIKISGFLAVLILSFCFIKAEASSDLLKDLKGKIILKVEDLGQAFYINNQNETIHYLGRPKDAFNVMKEQGLGITNQDLDKIPLGLDNLSGQDSDLDGLPDLFEESIGTNPNYNDSDGDGFDDFNELKKGYSPMAKFQKIVYDLSFAKNQSGRILLQVEKNGQAWYVNPSDNKRYFLGRPDDAFNIMRNLGLGVSNENFNKLDSSKQVINIIKKEVDKISDLDINVNMENVSNCGGIDCFKDEFANCNPGSNLTTSLGGLNITYYYQIIGLYDEYCQVISKFIENPNPAWENKEMSCLYDNSLDFEKSILDTSHCQGELYDLVYQGIEPLVESFSCLEKCPNCKTGTFKKVYDFSEDERGEETCLECQFNSDCLEGYVCQNDICFEDIENKDLAYEECSDDIWCYHDKMVETNEPSNCYKINEYWEDADQGVVGYCLLNIANNIKDCTICDLIEKEDSNALCIKEVCG